MLLNSGLVYPVNIEVKMLYWSTITYQLTIVIEIDTGISYRTYHIPSSLYRGEYWVAIDVCVPTHVADLSTVTLRNFQYNCSYYS